MNNLKPLDFKKLYTIYPPMTIG